MACFYEVRRTRCGSPLFESLDTQEGVYFETGAGFVGYPRAKDTYISSTSKVRFIQLKSSAPTKHADFRHYLHRRLPCSGRQSCSNQGIDFHAEISNGLLTRHIERCRRRACGLEWFCRSRGRKGGSWHKKTVGQRCTHAHSLI